MKIHRARFRMPTKRSSGNGEIRTSSFILAVRSDALAYDKDKKEERVPSYLAALAAFEKARLLAPLEESYPLDMAFVYDQMGRFTEAEWMYRIARSLDPRSRNISQMYQNHLDAWKNSAPEEKQKAEN